MKSQRSHWGARAAIVVVSAASICSSRAAWAPLAATAGPSSRRISATTRRTDPMRWSVRASSAPKSSRAAPSIALRERVAGTPALARTRAMRSAVTSGAPV